MTYRILTLFHLLHLLFYIIKTSVALFFFLMARLISCIESTILLPKIWPKLPPLFPRCISFWGKKKKYDEQKQYMTVYREIHMFLGEREFNYTYFMLYLVILIKPNYAITVKIISLCLNLLSDKLKLVKWFIRGLILWLQRTLQSLRMNSKRENVTAVVLTWPKLKHQKL